MKLKHKTKLFLIGLSPLAAGMLMHYVANYYFVFAALFNVAFLVIWYKVGRDTVLNGKNVKESMIILNIPALVFLISDFIYEFIL